MEALEQEGQEEPLSKTGACSGLARVWKREIRARATRHRAEGQNPRARPRSRGEAAENPWGGGVPDREAG